jgi:membrane-associated protease RseP (regulator of RpoE activity)
MRHDDVTTLALSSTPPRAPGRRRLPAATGALAVALVGWAVAPSAARAQAAVGTSPAAQAARQAARATCAADAAAMLDPERRQARELLRGRVEMGERRRVDTVVVRTHTRRAQRGDVEASARVEAIRQMDGVLSLHRTPTGWLGTTNWGPSVRWISAEGQVIRYCVYPEVVAVEPGSPAQKAGIVAGDTVLAYNGRDVTSGDVLLDKLLVPGARLEVRLRQDGRTRERTVTIGRRPAEAPMEPGAEFAITTPSLPSLAPWAVRPPSAIVYSYGVGGGSGVIAGAQVIAMEEELRESLDLEHGLLVLKVARGTMASEAGLRAGDVIQAANGQRVSSVAALYRVIRDASAERSVQLELRRDRKKKEIALRW